MGTFQIVRGRKVGGNVATYFCTAEARVLHAIAGPVEADTLRREAQWVLDLHAKAKKAGTDGDADFVKFIRQAHADRLKNGVALEEEKDERSAKAKRGRGNEAALAADVHELLARQALDDIDKVYPKVWEGILKEKLSNDPVRFR